MPDTRRLLVPEIVSEDVLQLLADLVVGVDFTPSRTHVWIHANTRSKSEVQLLVAKLQRHHGVNSYCKDVRTLQYCCYEFECRPDLAFTCFYKPEDNAGGDSNEVNN